MSYSPTAIENKGGGHHRQITITFPNESRGSKILEFIIKDIAGVKERGFRWVLE
ncbi:MAG: hypothetical protein OEN50_18560 [Deltaproteobacteria bacterium]|nr:hypothetical protein [Deltaproteobacteria bacterium]